MSGFEYSEPVKALRTIKNNIYLIPNSTVLLGKTLENYYKENQRVLKMIMTPGVSVDNMGHFHLKLLDPLLHIQNLLLVRFALLKKLEIKILAFMVTI